MRFLSFLFATVLLAPFQATAQSGEDHWLNTFVVPGAYGEESSVEALARTADAIYVGGRFDLIDDLTTQNVAVWTGSQFESLGGGLVRSSGEAIVYALLAATDGSIYAAGKFTSAIQPNGSELEVNGIAKWNGAEWEPLGEGLHMVVGDPFPAEVYALAESAEIIHVGGLFDRATNTGGLEIDAQNLAQWDGNAWFTPVGVDGIALSLVIDEVGALYVGGDFQHATYPNGTELDEPYLAKMFANVWQVDFNGVDDTVHALEFDGDDIFAGGEFLDAILPGGGSLVVNNVARWDGTTWHGLELGTDAPVYALSADQGGGVFVGGEFDELQEIGGSTIQSPLLARWDGSGWIQQPIITPSPADVHALVAIGADEVVAGGDFFGGAPDTDADFVSARHLIRRTMSSLVPLSTVEEPMGLTSAEDYNAEKRGVLGLERSACGDLLAVGPFDQAGPEIVTGFAKWDGTSWDAVGLLSSEDITPWGIDVAAESCDAGNDAFYISGVFSEIGSPGGTPVPASRVAYWDGSTWNGLGGGVSGPIYSMAPTGNGVYVGGTIDRVFQPGGQELSVDYIAFWNKTTGFWELIGGTVLGPVYSVAVDQAGALYVGGNFPGAQQPGGDFLTSPYLIKWNGTLWESIGVPGGIVEVLKFDSGGDLYVGGGFQSVDGIPAQSIAKWDGQVWAALGEGIPGNVLDIAFDSERWVYAAGDQALGWWNGDDWTYVANSMDITSVAIGPLNHLYVGGSFNTIGGIASPYIADWDAPIATLEAIGLPETPAVPSLLSAYPNPFGSTTSLSFELAGTDHVRLAIYDVLGREVTVLVDESLSAGWHVVQINGASLSDGHYFTRLEFGDRVLTRMLTHVD